MARFAAPKNSFLAGELSPKVYGQSSLPQYANGAKSLLNTIVPLQGGAETRTGTEFMRSAAVNPAKSGQGRLIPFIVSASESYVILLSDSTLSQGLQIFDSSGNLCSVSFLQTPITLPTGFYTPPTPTFSQVDLYQYQYAQSSDVLYLVHKNHRPIVIRRTATSTFFYSYYDDMWALMNGGAGTSNLIKTILAYPYLDLNRQGITLTPTPGTGASNPVLQGQQVILTASSSLFDPGHVGAYFKFNENQVAWTAVVQITSVQSATQATGVALTSFVSTHTVTSDMSGSVYWQESAWSDYRGWPGTVCFFEGRLLMGGSKYQPDTLWGSRVSNYHQFMAEMLVQDWNATATGIKSDGTYDATTKQSGLDYFGTSSAGQVVVETNPFSFTLSSQQVNPIQWLSARETLSIGTLGAEYVANPGQDRVLSALNPSFIPQTAYGSSLLRALKVGPATLFVVRDGKTIRDFSYDRMYGVYKAQDISAYAEHLFHPHATTQILDWAFQPSRNLVWFLLQGTDKTQSLIALTFDKDKGVAAFHHHVLGGHNQYVDINFVTQGCAPQVTGLCVIPNPQTGLDDLWLNVTRMVNGASVSYLERMGSPFVETDFNLNYAITGATPFFSDCSKMMQSLGSPQASWAVGVQLKGETVNVLADGKIHPQVVVDGTGAITLQYPASQLVVGLPFQQRIELLPLEQGAVLGSASGAILRIDQAAIHFYNTCAAKIGRSDTLLETINFVPPGQPMTTEILPFTGMKRLPFAGDYTEQTSVILMQDQPLPMNISSITLRGLTNET